MTFRISGGNPGRPFPVNPIETVNPVEPVNPVETVNPVEPFGDWYLESLWDSHADDAEYISALTERYYGQ